MRPVQCPRDLRELEAITILLDVVARFVEGAKSVRRPTTPMDINAWRVEGTSAPPATPLCPQERRPEMPTLLSSAGSVTDPLAVAIARGVL